MAAFALFGAALGATAYLAVQEMAEKPEAVVMPSLPTEVTPIRPTSEFRAEIPAPEAIATTDETPSVESVPAAAEPSQLPRLPERRTHRKAATAPPTAKGVTRASVAVPAAATQTAATSAAAEPAQLSTPPALASAVIAPPTPARDRWDGMSAAIAACSSEKFLAGVVCTERVRLEYCEGFWGQVPQCRAATRPGTSR